MTKWIFCYRIWTTSSWLLIIQHGTMVQVPRILHRRAVTPWSVSVKICTVFWRMYKQILLHLEVCTNSIKPFYIIQLSHKDFVMTFELFTFISANRDNITPNYSKGASIERSTFNSGRGDFSKYNNIKIAICQSV